MNAESDPLLARLDEAVRRPAARQFLAGIVAEVHAALRADPTLRLTWRSMSPHLFGELPREIGSSWVFVLRAHCSSGAERHPNSIQRMMSWSGSGDMQIWNGSSWRPTVLTSDPSGTLGERWISIPENVWHRPVMGDDDWVVVSFHTATAETLLEERPSDDARPDDGPASAERYAGRSGRD